MQAAVEKSEVQCSQCPSCKLIGITGLKECALCELRRLRRTVAMQTLALESFEEHDLAAPDLDDWGRRLPLVRAKVTFALQYARGVPAALAAAGEVAGG